MALPAFDTLRIANRLKAVGVPSAQAEAEAEVLSEVFEVNLKELATKEDLRATKEDLRREIGDLRKDMDAKHESLRKDIDAKHESLRKDLFHEIRALESRLTVRLGKIVFSGVGILVPSSLPSNSSRADSRRHLPAVFLNTRSPALPTSCFSTRHKASLAPHAACSIACLNAQCPRMPPLRPNAAFAFDGDLPVRPGKIKLPTAISIKAILPQRLRQLCDAHPQRKLRFQYAHRLPLAAPVGNVQPALLAQKFDRHERVSPWQLHLSRQAGGFRRRVCVHAKRRKA